MHWPIKLCAGCLLAAAACAAVKSEDGLVYGEAAGEKLEFVRRHAAPVEIVGDTIAHILTAPPGAFANGGNLQIQDIARELGTLPA